MLIGRVVLVFQTKVKLKCTARELEGEINWMKQNSRRQDLREPSVGASAELQN